MSDVENVNKLQFEIEWLQNQLDLFSWVDDADGSLISKFNTQAKEMLKLLKIAKDFAIEPHKKHINVLKDKFKPLEDRLSTILVMTDNYAQLWYANQEQKVRETKEYAKMAEVQYGISILTPDAPSKISSTHGTSMVKDKMVFEIVDEEKIPRKYLMVDEKAVKQAISMGVCEIPGIEIRTERKITLRKK